MSMNTKKQQREYLKAVRSSIPKAERELKSAEIAGRLFKLPGYKKVETVMIYISFGSEVNTSAIFNGILRDGKRLVVPRCGNNLSMTGYVISDRSQLEEGSYGIPEPSERLIVSGEIIAADKSEIDLIIVPGLGFDSEGYRIGYGMGYYDRYLSGFGGSTVGLCFSECLLSRVCRDEFDKRIETVLTDVNNG